MPTNDHIAAALAAYDRANPLAPLPRNTARLLAAMFGSGDVCQRSLDAIAAEGFNRKNLPAVLRRLGEAGFLSVQRGSSRVADTYRLHLPAVRP
jgi:hypothetical protein